MERLSTLTVQDADRPAIVARSRVGGFWRGLMGRPVVAELDSDVGGAEPDGARPRLRRRHWYFLLVVLPTLLTTLYLECFAADQYMSEFHFFVADQATLSSGMGSNGSGGGSSGGASSATTSTSGVSVGATLAAMDYLQSKQAVIDLRKSVDLVGMYRRPEADLLARVWNNPTNEQLYRYLYLYHDMISVDLDITTSVGVVQVRAFRPEDAETLAKSLADAGNQIVKRFAEQLQTDALKVTHNEVDRSEERVKSIEAKLTQFRLAHDLIDPGKSSETILGVVAALEGSLATAQAQLKATQSYQRSDSPQVKQLELQVASLQGQLDAEKKRLTGDDGSLAPVVSAYEQLMIERGFAQQDYTTALAALEAARAAADQQHLFLVRVVDPTAAQEAEYPRSILIIVSMFVCLSVAYAISWLIWAGFHEHSS